MPKREEAPAPEKVLTPQENQANAAIILRDAFEAQNSKTSEGQPIFFIEPTTQPENTDQVVLKFRKNTESKWAQDVFERTIPEINYKLFSANMDRHTITFSEDRNSATVVFDIKNLGENVLSDIAWRTRKHHHERAKERADAAPVLAAETIKNILNENLPHDASGITGGQLTEDTLRKTHEAVTEAILGIARDAGIENPEALVGQDRKTGFMNLVAGRRGSRVEVQ